MESVTASARTDGQRVHPLTPLAKGLLYIAGGTGIALNRVLEADDYSRSFWVRGGIIVGAFILIAFAFGYLSWRHTRYLLAPDAVKVATGWLVRTDRSVTYARIQSVDVTEPFVARLLGLAGLRIDVAGGDKPVKLEYVRKSLAEQLHAQLIDEAMRHRQSADAEIRAAGDEAAPGEDVAAADLARQNRGCCFRIPTAESSARR